MNKLRNVVFTGQLHPGVDPDQAARAFAETFKVPEEQARQLIRAGQPQVLKRDVEPAAAERYREVLEEIGWHARIDMPVDLTKPASDRAASPVAAATPSRPVRGDLERPDGPARVPFGHGWEWIVGGFALFRAAPWAWIGVTLVFMAINFALALIPAIGGLASTLLGPVFLGGLMLGAQEQRQGGILRLDHLFAGFRGDWARLVAVGGLYLLGSVLIAIAVVVFLVVVLGVSGASDGTLELGARLEPSQLLALSIALALLVPLLMAYWFAPALVALDAMTPVAAMRLSFVACWRNLAPLLVYGLIALGLLALAAMPFLLGLLVVSPVLIASLYVAYRDIFHARSLF